MIAKNKVNVNDDGEVLKNIYMELTKPERVDMDEEKAVHWIGKTFDHAPLVGAVASLTAMQQEILAARATAVAHIKSRVSTGEYSFNKIVGLAYGPAVANSGDEVELKVMMAAFDTDNQPTVTGPGAITVADGQGVVKVRVSGGAEMPVSGTVSIKNKSGATKTEKWTHTIKIMKPQGTVSLPDLRVLYRGYSNMVEAVASGYDQTTISGSGVTLSKSGAQWVATPGAGKTCSISVFGKNSITNKSVNLGSFTFDIKSMPKAEIYWGKASDGEKVSSRTAKNLYAGYGEAIPLTKAKFNVTQWAMSIPGAPKTVVGQGSTLSDEAMRYLKAAPAGSQVMFSCVYSGTGVSNKTATSAFKL
jgi:gliding motility-associated protein GldM